MVANLRSFDQGNLYEVRNNWGKKEVSLKKGRVKDLTLIESIEIT
jgi:hypothetical protein